MPELDKDLEFAYSIEFVYTLYEVINKRRHNIELMTAKEELAEDLLDEWIETMTGRNTMRVNSYERK